ncbi:MAG: bifunctional 3-deoxy-7-phosphoheptulonate synthase/chorismate mutase type II [Bacteroidetes bacterium]|nr:bifunctional 3-deoxy-7-phosphoheptulonate synthase/chorismate mutase type II [Bacteroidota bacterium]
MNIQPIFDKKKRPIVIAGPCSAETREQVLQTARNLAPLDIDLYRAGIWKPRTRPDSFEGVGRKGLAWLQEVKQETGLKVTTEVANREHVFEALKHGVDVLWIGARTTVNPFSVQEIADALEGTKIPVIVKNPINPDLKLWMGALERLYKAGLEQLAVIHRGFSFHGQSSFRNVPRWQIPIELKRQFPNIEIICDNSHICGRRDTLQAVAQQAMDLNFDGLMTEVHPTPDEAWSDAAQQITPAQFKDLLGELVFRNVETDNPEFLESLEHLRHEIDEIDGELLRLLGARMKLAERIGTYKKKNNISILQPTRWNEILEHAQQRAAAHGLSPDFVSVFLKSVHQESINHQNMVMNQPLVDEKE